MINKKHTCQDHRIIAGERSLYHTHQKFNILGLVLDGIRFFNFDGERHDIDNRTCTAIGLVKISCQCSVLCGAMRYEFENIKYFNTSYR